MMAASSGFSEGDSDGPNSSQATLDAQTAVDSAADDEFGSFAAAERLSDPFGDVYGAEADFGDFVGGSSGPHEAAAPSITADGSSLMSFSPLVTATAPPALLPSISGEVDPFADITGGLGAAAETPEVVGKTMEAGRGFEGELTTSAGVAAAPASTSAILDLVWGNTSREAEVNTLSASATSVGSAGDGSRTASNPSGFMLHPPPSTKFATFPSAAGSTPEAATGDLLSFSPVQASAPSDPFFGISNDTTETSAAALAFGNDDLFTLTETAPLSAPTSSAPTSLHGSFASLHEGVKPAVMMPSTSGSDANVSPRDPFAERTTRSFGSLSSSFVSVGAVEDSAGQNGEHASYSTFTNGAATPSTVTPSPSSAPPSLHSSFKITKGFVGFAAATDESDEMDPFAEAGLAAPEEVPLAEALAAWSTSAKPAAEAEEEESQDEKSQEVAQDGGKHEIDQTGSSYGLGPAVDIEEYDTSDATHQTKPADVEGESLDRWPSADITIASTDRNDEDVFNGEFANDQQATSVSAVRSPAAAIESERQSVAVFTEPTEIIAATVHDDNIDAPIGDENDEEVHALGLQDNAFEDEEFDSNEDDGSLASNNAATWPMAQRPAQDAEAFEASHTEPFALSTAAVDEVTGVDSSQRYDAFSAPHSSPDSDLEALPIKFGQPSEETVVENDTEKDQKQVAVADDDFSDFGGFEAASAPTTSAAIIPDASPWGSFPSPTPVQNMRVAVENGDDAFGDFTVAESSTGEEDNITAVEDDGFADFAQNTDPSGNGNFGNFGNFTESSANDAGGFTDFQQSNAQEFGEDDDDFGDFAPAATPVTVTVTSLSLSAPSFSKTELSSFFMEAFPTDPVPTSTVSPPESPTDMNDTDIAQDVSTEFVQDVFCNMWDEYVSILAATGRQSSSSSGSFASGSESNENGENARLGKKTTRASKYLKYALSEKIQEASRQNGIFPHGSERHQMYVGLAASGDADRMRAGLKELQDALFHNSVNDAMMRIAKQAALSAKAKIAEQAAQQQANSRGGSLFSTTRHLLSRGGSATGAHGPGSSGNDSKSDHAGADTPTGASVQKLARFSFTNSHEDTANGHRGVNSGEERVSEGSDHTGHSSGSDSEAAAGAGDSRTRSQTLSNSVGSNGGLMKKFQDRFSFASSRHRPRFVSLRRKGQSGEEVRKMELNLDAISGGLDEVKWKCAMFLYDVEEVAHVAPSQINILSYPSKQPLTGKTDRSALTKLVKPDTIWSVDIGANNSDMLNEW